jgi:hypothetical protein
MVIERMARRFAGVIWEVGEHFIIPQELFKICKRAMARIKAGDFTGADKLMKETPATDAIWAEVLK